MQSGLQPKVFKYINKNMLNYRKKQLNSILHFRKALFKMLQNKELMLINRFYILYTFMKQNKIEFSNIFSSLMNEVDKNKMVNFEVK